MAKGKKKDGPSLIQQLDKITRLEVIDEDGRQYVNMSVIGMEFSFQDDGKTLKLFVDTDKHAVLNNRLQSQSLDELTKLSQELGMYDK